MFKKIKKAFQKLVAEAVISMAGGVSGLIGIALAWFNENVLSKIKDKEEAAAYCRDVQEFGAFLNNVFDRHSKWMSEKKRAAAKATVDAVTELAKAMEDSNITPEELDVFVDAVQRCIEEWIRAK